MSRLIILLWILLYGPVSGLLQSTEGYPENPEVLQVKLKSGKTVTGDALPSVKTILTWVYVLVAILLAALFFGILTVLIMSMLPRNKADSSPDDLESDCVKQSEQPILGQQPDEFAIVSDQDGYNDKLAKCDAVKCVSEAEPSTVNSVDIETPDSVGDQKTWSHCICGQRQTTPDCETSSIMSEPVYAVLCFSDEEETTITFDNMKEDDDDMPQGLLSRCFSCFARSESSDY